MYKCTSTVLFTSSKLFLMLNFGRKLVLADNNGINFFASLYEGEVKNETTGLVGLPSLCNLIEEILVVESS